MLTEFGSHLYGTSTPKSDKDYKGVFIPCAELLLLDKVPKSYRLDTNTSNEKNTAEDIDIEVYSLHYFLELACKGETVALDMLHAPDQNILWTTQTWKELAANRDKFYTKNLKAFVGYARKQAAKYGVKGSRLDAAKKVLDFLGELEGQKRLHEVWDDLPTGEHITKTEEDPDVRFRTYTICGKQIQETVTARYAYDILSKFYQNYGHRAKQASENKGIDWKAMSHAIRAAVQVREILQFGSITFPLAGANYIRKVKQGEYDFQLVMPVLEHLMEEVDQLSATSTLPEKVDRKFWEDFLLRKCVVHLRREIF